MTAPWIALVAALWAIVFVLGLLVLGLLNRASTLLDRVQEALERGDLGGQMVGRGLSAGSPLPMFTGRTPSGDSVTNTDLRGFPAVVLFLDPDCRPCRAIASQLREGPARLDGARLVVVMRNAEEAHSMGLGESPTIVFEPDNSVSMGFETAVTPNAFAVSADGRIVARRIPGSADDLVELAREAMGGR